MATIFEPPPTYAPLEITLPDGSRVFNPIWVNWLYQLGAEINGFNVGLGVLTAGPTSDASAFHGHRNLVAPTDVSPTISPTTYTNTSTKWDQDYLVIGSATLQWQRGSNTYTLTQTDGFIHLSPGDSLIVSYSSAPQIIQIYR